MKYSLIFLCLFSITASAQDTLRFSLPDAQKQFTDKNLLVLAQKYNIEVQKAQIIQAGLVVSTLPAE